MKTKITSAILSVGILAALAAWGVRPSRVDAQTQPAARTKPASKAALSRTPGVAERPPREVAMTGRVVSLHSFMTGQNASADQARITADNIRAGVPAALETPTGLILLGQGTTGVARTLAPLAFQQVEVHGKMYEKGGVKYIDIAAVEAVEEEVEEEAEEAEEEVVDE